MDILRPDLVWIDNRCYRQLLIKEVGTKSYVEEDLFPAQLNKFIDEPDEEDRDECRNLPIKLENGKFWISIAVPGPLVGFVCGKKNNTKSQIERETGVTIKIPSKQFTAKRCDFVLTGSKKISVRDAYLWIERIMSSGRWRVAEYTHFISIPMNNKSIQTGFSKFREHVLERCRSARGIMDAVFSLPAKLHLTIAMLTLLDEKEIELAKAELNKCKGNIIEMLNGKKLRLEMKGIEIMNDDPSEVDVLYAEVRETDGNNLLQIIADKMYGCFIESGFTQREYEKVKLHVTLMKARTIKGERGRFDARPLLKEFSDYSFGTTEVDEIHISIRRSGYDKYYNSSSMITL